MTKQIYKANVNEENGIDQPQKLSWYMAVFLISSLYSSFK